MRGDTKTRRLAHLGLMGLCLTLGASVLSAQPAEVVSKVPEGLDPAKSAGIFVGVQSFDDPTLADIPFAVDDAVDLAHLLSLELGLVTPKNVVLLLSGEPRKPDSVRRLADLLEAGATRAGADLALVSKNLSEYSGRAGADGILFLSLASHRVDDVILTSDSSLEHAESTGIPWDVVAGSVSSTGTPYRLALIDTNREHLSASRSTFRQEAAGAHSWGESMAVLSGAWPGGFAYDDFRSRNSVFAAAVLEGLKGGAAGAEDGSITVAELSGFVNSRVESWIKDHRPWDFQGLMGLPPGENPYLDLPLVQTLPSAGGGGG